MKVFDLDKLYEGNVVESITVESFGKYKELGGTMDILDAYSLTKDRAKKYELEYIQGMDMSLSGIPVDDSALKRKRLLAQVFWTILHLWFNKPLRIVSFADFDLGEFNKL